MKAWKLLQVVGVLILLLGVIVRIGGSFYGVHMGLVGLLLFAVGRVMVWLKSDQP